MFKMITDPRPLVEEAKINYTKAPNDQDKGYSCTTPLLLRGRSLSMKGTTFFFIGYAYVEDFHNDEELYDNHLWISFTDQELGIRYWDELIDNDPMPLVNAWCFLRDVPEEVLNLLNFNQEDVDEAKNQSS